MVPRESVNADVLAEQCLKAAVKMARLVLEKGLDRIRSDWHTLPDLKKDASEGVEPPAGHTDKQVIMGCGLPNVVLV